MTRYALLCGSAAQGKIQKKIEDMHTSLTSGAAGAWRENEIMIFPNGIDEKSLAYVLNTLRMSGIAHILLYICTVSPVADDEQTVWLGGNEIRKSIFEKPASLSGFVQDAGGYGKGAVVEPVGATPATTTGNLSASAGRFSVQVIYDSDREFVSGEDWFYDEECAPEFSGMEIAGAGR